MNSPAFPPLIEIALVSLAEVLFGVGYNAIVDWAKRKDIYDTLISFSVAIGVMVTVALPTGIWFGRQFTAWQWSILMGIAFLSSGSVMIIGSLKREADRNSHKRHAWPTAAAHARDDAVMDLTALASQAAAGRVSIPMLVQRLHEVIGILKSV